ncbi:MAG TPA: protein kinase [Thermoanaerobaculia bacterium]|nr:protein kinase [Thermoanaerobaculia bacterium]
MSAGRIVIADDNNVNRMLLGGILEQAGYDVRVANDGAEALELVDRDPPELVLLDIQMPRMNGYEVCREMRARPRLRPIPVVFISALDDVGEKVKGFEAGGTDYVTKPFEAAEVLARVGTQLQIFRLNHELKQRNLELERRNHQLILAQQKTEHLFGALSVALAGTVLDETYRLEEKIGEGGFGAVYRGVHLRLRRRVAVKILRPASSTSADKHLARFRREGIAACRITHPNAVEVLDFGVSSSGIAYLVMELLDGKTLGSLLREKGSLSPQRCAEIIAPVCDALLSAHNAGIVHRDIKPDNVFLHQGSNGEVVKVVDFGIAKLLDDTPDPNATQLGTCLGTPCYMAPERLLGNAYDERSDIYSVGVTLYLALSGALPFDHLSPNLAEMIKLHLTAKPRPLLEVRDDIPADLGELVMESLDPNPTHRPPLSAIAQRLRGLSSIRTTV